MKKEVEGLLNRLELDFQGFAKELRNLKYVVDLAPVGPRQKQKLFQEFPRAYYKSNDFLVLSSPQQLHRAEQIIARSRQQSAASIARKEEFALELSKVAQARLSNTIIQKTKQYKKYTSPEVRADISDSIRARLNKFKLVYLTDTTDPQHLKDQLLTSTIKGISDEIKKTQDLFGSVKARADDIVYTAKTGKIRNTTRRKRVTAKSKKKVKTEKQYYAPVDEPRKLAAAVDFRTMLNGLLHDTIKDKFMESSGAAPDYNYLRYQTGRFARSAKVLDVSDRQAGLTISYSYMEYPYAVFKKYPHGPGRNPEGIISGAIREIMQNYVTNLIIRKA